MTRFSQPNFTTIRPDGSVDAIFPGAIQMFAADPGSGPLSRRITWVRDDDGAMVAYMSAFTASGAGAEDQLSIQVGRLSNDPPGTGNASKRVDIGVATGLGNDGGGLGAMTDDSGIGGSGTVAVTAGAQNINTDGLGPAYAMIINAGGRSSFLRLPQSVFGAAVYNMQLTVSGSVGVPALAVQATASSPSFNSGLPTDFLEGSAFNFARAFGDYLQSITGLTHGFTVNTAGATVVIQAAHRNCANVATAACSFGQFCLCGYS